MEFARTDIRNIAFSKINERFSKGKYLGVEVTIDMTNGYIHGSHLTKQVLNSHGKPKEFDDWKRLKSSRIIIEYLAPQICGAELIVDVVDVPVGLRGAYIHPRLVVHVAQWASPIFADKVAIIINNKAVEEALLEKNKELVAKDIKIDELSQKIDNQSKQISELLSYARKSDEDAERMIEELNQIATEANETNQSLEKVQTKLGIAVERRVPADPIRCRNEIIAIYHNQNKGLYKVVRCQYRNVASSVNRCRLTGYTRPIYSKEDPNAVNIWNRARLVLDPIAKVTGGYFLELREGKAEADLVGLLRRVEAEKEEV
jgi:low affinity Fe/Cu permease